MSTRRIPPAVVMVVGDVLGGWYYSHTRIDTLFAEMGAPGEPPEGNCVRKCQAWLRRCNEDPTVDPLRVLGRVLEEYMVASDEGGEAAFGNHRLVDGAARIRRALVENGLSYGNGRIYGGGAIPAARTFSNAIRERDLTAVEDEFEKAMERVESHPRDALTAACSLLESLFKHYIEEMDLETPSKQEIGRLWKVVQRHLGLAPGENEGDDMKRVLSGLSSIVDGVGALRTHAGAHGRGRDAFTLEPRHARLAVNAAHTVALFILEEWQRRL